MTQSPPWENGCEGCLCAQPIRAYARSKGVSMERALALLQEKLKQETPPAGQDPHGVCLCDADQAARCPVFLLACQLAACCGMSVRQWLERADLSIEGEYEAQGKEIPDPTGVPQEPDEPEEELEPDNPKDKKHHKIFVVAFGVTIGAIVLAMALFGTYQWGYQRSLTDNGTFDEGYSAAVAEGTYEDGHAAGYEEGYQAGYREGLQEGFEQGKDAGYSDGYANGSADVQQAQSDAQQAQSDIENARRSTPVWISWIGSKYHLDPECSRIWGGEQITLGQAEDEGYDPCPKCVK
ncbi:hypothetical protein [uncultured Ruthenibacterium sp.]|uniref:hypothetical protein n=1 Tax=uncultured Ruthenibacterium sp. TaxID=1905347 RepID=UPI00349EAC00